MWASCYVGNRFSRIPQGLALWCTAIALRSLGEAWGVQRMFARTSFAKHSKEKLQILRKQKK